MRRLDMIGSALPLNGLPYASARRFWLAVAVVGGAWLFVGHHPAVSSYETYAPWSETEEIQASGGNVVKGMVLGLIGLLGLYFLTSPRAARGQAPSYSPIEKKSSLRGDSYIGSPSRLRHHSEAEHRVRAFDAEGAEATRPSSVRLLSVLLGFYVLWAVLSLTWSIDPALTARRLAVMIFCVLGMLGIARQLSPRQWAASVLVITTTYLALGVVAELAYGTLRPWAAGYRFAGTVHPNTQGVQLAFLCLSAFVLARSTPPGRQRTWMFVLFAVGFVFLVLTKSRTSLSGMLLGTAIMFFSSRSERSGMVPFSAPRWDGRGQSAWRSAERGSLRADLLSRRNGDSARFLFPPKALVLAVAGFLVALTVLMASLLNVDLDRQLASAALLGRQEESSLLTGRVPIWQELLRYVCERPWTGYGYESFWTPLHIEEFSKEMHWRFREAHSSYLDAVLSVGLIGAGALLAAVLLALARARTLFRLTGDPGYGLSLGLLAFALVSATLESGMASMNFFSLVIGCGIVQLLSRISRP